MLFLAAENPGKALREGMIARARITLLHYPEAVVIPVSAVQVTDQGPRVLVVAKGDEGEITAARAVEPISINADMVHVGEGLVVGDRLVVSGWKGVAPGEPVNVVVEDGQLAAQGQ